MTRSLSWIGWSALLCAGAAAIVVGHQFTTSLPQDQPAAERMLPTGATFAPIDQGGRTRLVVTSLQTDGPGARAGLRVGDRIEYVDGLPAPTLAAFEHDVAQGGSDLVDLKVQRRDRLIDIHMRRGDGRKHG